MPDKAIFLDRDGTLIEDLGYISNPNQVKLRDGVAEALIELRSMGYKLVVASNQSAVARGIITEKTLGDIHNRLRQLLAEKGAFLDEIYYCPYHPEGVVARYRKESDWRKPHPGMLLAAARQMDIDLSQSWMLGDSGRDLEAGRQAGCMTILIEHPAHRKRLQPQEPRPDYKAVNIKEAVNIIKKYHRFIGKAEPETLPYDVSQTELISQAPEPVGQLPDTNSQTSIPSEPQEPADRPRPAKQQETPDNQRVFADRTEQLLGGILEQLKNMQRADMFGEFSIMRFLAGMVQIVVLFCLLLTIWFLMSPKGQDNAVLISLGFAMVLQLMSLTFYIMQGRK